MKTILIAGILLPLSCSIYSNIILPERNTFYITPTIDIQGLFACEEGLKNLKFTTLEQVNDYCISHKLNAAPGINRILDQLEPGGAKGQVQVGYVATLQLLALYKREGSNWVIDENKLQVYLQLLTQVNRPVVVYLAADHFDSLGPLVDVLLKNPRNLMQLSNGKPATSNYFGYRIVPYTLQTDEKIPVNFYRFNALRRVIHHLAKLPKNVQDRIVGVTLAGELHQMFPDFESGTGRYENIQVTDYSPASINGFRQWLKTVYPTLQSFNTAHGSNLLSLKDTPAPAKGPGSGNIKSSLTYYDAYADGSLPIAGWLWDPQLRIKQLDLYMDGVKIGPVPFGFNRLDVYRAVEEVTNPNVGYRFDFDFSRLNGGKHLAQVVGTTDKGLYLLGAASFVVRQKETPSLSLKEPIGLPGLKAASDLVGVKTYLDLPKSNLVVHFNLLARDWNNYRSWQVRQFLDQIYRIARDAGLPSDKIFSHQVVPQVNSSWNSQLFSVEQTLATDVPWKLGINLYGGAANSDWIRTFLTQRKHTGYGVPEFNPQQWKQADVHVEAMRSHYLAGAKFISPYYLSATPERFRMKNQHGVNAMELRPDNPADGSDQFYRAIRQFAEH